MRSFAANALILSTFCSFSLLSVTTVSAQEKKKEERPRLFKGGLIKRIEEMQDKIKKDREDRQKARQQKELEKKKAEAARKQKEALERDAKRRDSKVPISPIPASSRRGPDPVDNDSPVAPQLDPIPTDLKPQVSMGIEVRKTGITSNGLIIEVVDKSGPADIAGLKVEDRITSVGGSPIKKTEDLRLIMSAFEPGDRTEIEYVRGGKKKSTLLEFPGKKTYGGLALNAPQKNGTEELPLPKKPIVDRRTETALPNGNSGVPILPLESKRNQEFRSGIGVTAVAVDPQIFAQRKLSVRQGAFLEQISKDSAAEKAGLKTGDVVVALDGRKIDSAVGMAELVQSYQPGEKAQVLYYRGSRLMRSEIKMDAIPVSELDFPAKPINPIPQTAQNNKPNRNSILGDLSKEFPRLKKVEDIIEKFGGKPDAGQPATRQPLTGNPSTGRSAREIELENEVNSLRNQLKGQNRQIEDLTEKLNIIERLLKDRK